jgi:hypothetical protein
MLALQGWPKALALVKKRVEICLHFLNSKSTILIAMAITD